MIEILRNARTIECKEAIVRYPPCHKVNIDWKGHEGVHTASHPPLKPVVKLGQYGGWHVPWSGAVTELVGTDTQLYGLGSVWGSHTTAQRLVDHGNTQSANTAVFND